MALTQEHVIDTTVLYDGQIQVNTITINKENGVEISRLNHRHVVDVGDDVTGEDQIVQDIAATVHTQARIDARAAFIAANTI